MGGPRDREWRFPQDREWESGFETDCAVFGLVKLRGKNFANHAIPTVDSASQVRVSHVNPQFLSSLPERMIGKKIARPRRFGETGRG
jgi:hypothetical protein